MIIGRHPVLGENINEGAEEEMLKKSIEWKRNHIRESLYFLQIVKCLDENCCRPSRSISRTTTVFPLLKMWSTGDCVQCVVDIHGGNVVSQTGAQKSANKRKWPLITIRTTSKTAAYCHTTSERLFMCIPVPGIGVGRVWWCWYWGIDYTWSFVHWTRDSCNRDARVVLERGVKTKHPVLYSTVCF